MQWGAECNICYNLKISVIQLLFVMTFILLIRIIVIIYQKIFFILFSKIFVWISQVLVFSWVIEMFQDIPSLTIPYTLLSDFIYLLIWLLYTGFFQPFFVPRFHFPIWINLMHILRQAWKMWCCQLFEAKIYLIYIYTGNMAFCWVAIAGTTILVPSHS